MVFKNLCVFVLWTIVVSASEAFSKGSERILILSGCLKLMTTYLTGFRWFFKNLCILVLWMKVASVLEG